MARRIKHRSSRRPSVWSLLVIRSLLVANGLILLAVGALYIRFGSRVGGLIAGCVLIGVAALLFGCVPLTDPYRRRRR